VVSDNYVLQFIGAAKMDASTVNLAHKVAGKWQPINKAECTVKLPWSDTMLDIKLSRSDNCAEQPLVGIDNTYGNHWWVVLNQD
jgi:hypothetical protein